MSTFNSDLNQADQLKPQFPNSIFFLKLIFLGLLTVLLLILVNALNDPNRLLHGDEGGMSWREPNQNFLKMRHLLNHKPYDLLIFGSSRVQTIPFAKLRLPEGVVYNMGTFARNLWTTRHDLEILKRENKLPKKILLGLDETVYAGDEINRQKMKGYIAYPADLFEWLWFFKTYFLSKDQKSYEFIERLWWPKPLIRTFDITGSGELNYSSNESQIEANPIAWANRAVFGTKIEQRVAVGVRDDLVDLVAIKKICDENQIELQVFFNPVYKKFFLEADLERILNLKRRVLAITEFRDFQTQFDLLGYAILWYDQEHYGVRLGELLLHDLVEVDGTADIHADTSRPSDSLDSQDAEVSRPSRLKLKTSKSGERSVWVTAENLASQEALLREYFEREKK